MFCQPVRLKACLSGDFQRSRGAVAMLQEFLRRGKRMGRQTWFQFRGGFQLLNLEFAHGFSLRWKVCQKTATEVVDYPVDFCGGFFDSEMQRKNPPKKSAGKSASREQKIRRRTTPPKCASQAQKSAARPTNKSVCQTSKYTPGFFD